MTWAPCVQCGRITHQRGGRCVHCGAAPKELIMMTTNTIEPTAQVTETSQADAVTVTDERGKFASRKFLGFLVALAVGGGLAYPLREYTATLGVLCGFCSAIYAAYVGGNVVEARAVMAGALTKAKALVAKPAAK